MTDNFGNLALERKPSPQSGARRFAPPGISKPLVFKSRRISTAATPGHEAVQQARAKVIRRSLAIQRIRLLLGSILVIFAVAGLFSWVVYRQAAILEMNFSNLSIERQITRLDQERSQISEELSLKTNLDLIRQQAIERLGLQDPAGSQIVRVIVPASDRIVFARPLNGSSDNEAYLAEVFKTVEGYFRSMNQQRQVN